MTGLPMASIPVDWEGIGAELKAGGLFRCASLELPETPGKKAPAVLASPLAPTTLVARMSSAPSTPHTPSGDAWESSRPKEVDAEV